MYLYILKLIIYSVFLIYLKKVFNISVFLFIYSLDVVLTIQCSIKEAVNEIKKFIKISLVYSDKI